MADVEIQIVGLRFTLSATYFLWGLIATYAAVVEGRTKFACSELSEVRIGNTASTLVRVGTSYAIDIKSTAIYTSTLFWIFCRDTFRAIIFRDALQTTRISLVAGLAFSINIHIVANCTGQTSLGVAVIAVWEFERASSAKFSLGVFVEGRLALFADVHSGAAEAIRIECFARNAMIIFTQIIPSYAFGAFQLINCLFTLKTASDQTVTRQAVSSIFECLFVASFALSIGAGLAIRKFRYAFFALFLLEIVVVNNAALAGGLVDADSAALLYLAA